MAIKLDSFNFDRGIDRIIHGYQLDAPLPDGSRLLPSDIASQPELEKLLALPNLQDYLFGFLQPDIPDRELLTPLGFQHALADATDTLRQGHAQAPADTPEARSLNKSLQLLNREADQRELLNMYRSLLFQG